MTPLKDIAWLVNAKPKNSVVLVDEVYLHLAGAPSAMALAGTHDNVFVMCTLSKIFGMAGMRFSLMVGASVLHKRMMRYKGDLVGNSADDRRSLRYHLAWVARPDRLTLRTDGIGARGNPSPCRSLNYIAPANQYVLSLSALLLST